MIVAPDEPYTIAEAAEILVRSERQVLRYVSSGRLRGSRASGRWMVAALQVWEFQGIADEMLANWREYCKAADAELGKTLKIKYLKTPGSRGGLHGVGVQTTPDPPVAADVDPCRGMSGHDER
jgi:hypothetical protein